MRILASRSWPDLVFHVLAHVEATAALPASLFDPFYVRFAARHLGPAAGRQLGEDAAVLGRVLVTHELLARAQLLAWLFAGGEQAGACAERDLAQLRPDEVADPSLLAPLAAAGPAVELLRCAAELERDAHGRLPPAELDPGPFAQALERTAAVAPLLADCGVMPLRALRLRGRVRGREIWVGLPSDEPGPELDHVVWQACHEATVLELGEQAGASGERLGARAVEHAAVVLLAARARDAGREHEHARWLGHLGTGTISTERDALGDVEAGLVAACRRERG
ncbi:MAG: hypothetical protein HY744_00860 [Deltaproteobacteria bacterium]|nr:hypothetical protein [Deltaproteobacteria bacterium]